MYIILILLLLFSFASILCSSHAVTKTSIVNQLRNAFKAEKVPWWKKLLKQQPNQHQAIDSLSAGLLYHCNLCLLFKLRFMYLKWKGKIIKVNQKDYKVLYDAAAEAILISDISKVTKTLELYVEKDSSNAYAIGIHPFKVVTVGVEILNLNLPQQCYTALILHELSHVRDRTMSSIIIIVISLLNSFPGTIPLLMAYSRRNEFNADLYAAKYCGEDNVCLLLQSVYGVHPWLIRFQSSSGIILPISVLRFLYPSIMDSNSRLENVLNILSTHPSFEKRIARLNLFKKEKAQYFNFSINGKRIKK